MLNKEKIWTGYLDALTRLDQVVRKQTIVLKNNDFNNLSILFGEKENAFLSLQMIAGQMAKVKNSENQESYSKFKKRATQLIEKIQKTETLNKDLLVDLMEHTKKQSKDLKKYSTKCKTYLSSTGVEQNVKLNVVS